VLNLTKSTYLVSDSVCIWTDADNWSEIHHAVLHEAQKLQGRYNFIDQTVNSKQSVVISTSVTDKLFILIT
jgi:hypothetical protein